MRKTGTEPRRFERQGPAKKRFVMPAGSGQNKPKRARPWSESAAQDREFRDTKQWQTLRDIKRRSDPLCAICSKPAEMVHHKTQPKGDRDMFFDQDNLASVCFHCHDQVHAAYGRGFDWVALTGE